MTARSDWATDHRDEIHAVGVASSFLAAGCGSGCRATAPPGRRGQHERRGVAYEETLVVGKVQATDSKPERILILGAERTR